MALAQLFYLREAIRRQARNLRNRWGQRLHPSGSSRSTHPESRVASAFQLEPLEGRILLSADLTGLVTAHTLLDPSVPTNAEQATIRVLNHGATATNQVSQVAVYASLDNTLDAGDVLLGSANAPKTISAGQFKDVNVALQMPNTLAAGTYNLLARVDATNAMVEGTVGEANNLTVGPQFQIAWQFGAVPGRTGNTVLTLRDADGTNVTFSLSGAGLGEVIRDGSNWDVKITGTTTNTAVTIVTNSAGNGRVTLNDIHVFGPLAAFTAATTDLTGTLAIDGPVNIPGLLPGTVTLGSIQGGVVAVPSVEALTVFGSVTNAKFFIGTTLGQDGQPGGSGTNTDTYGAGNIGLFTVAGSMTGTAVRVGINPVDGIYGNGNDALVGGTVSSIGGIIIGSSLSADTRFYAGAFPTQYLLGLTLKPTAGDFHFISNFSGPSLNAALQQDTGSSPSDRLTNNPTITGSVTDPQGIQTFVAGFGATPTFSILADRQANGSFTLSRVRLEQINGAPLSDGIYVLKLQATDTVGNSTQISVPFTLDTQVPMLTLDLAAASDTAPVGDQRTTNAIVTLAGQTEAGATVLLLTTNQTTLADAGGAFSFTNVSLTLGANLLTVRATDSAGNQRTATNTITRVLADSDGDGISDVNEGGGPNNGDANSDGIPDSQQGNVASLQNAIDNRYITLVSPTGTTLRNVQAGPMAPGAPADVTFPFGQIGFEVHGVTTGGSAEVTMLLPSGSLVNSFYKFGLEPSDPPPPLGQSHWYEFTQAGGTGATVNGDTVTLKFIDGARGDADLAPNRVIVDPGAFGVKVNQPPVLAPIGPQSVNEESELRFTVKATDPNPGDILQFGFVPRSGDLSGAQFIPNGVNSYEFIWTPNQGHGPRQYQVEFLAFDGGGPPTSEIVPITVNEVNRPPVIEALIGPPSVGEETEWQAQVIVSDPDLPANTLSVSWDAAAIALGVQGVQIAGTNTWDLHWTPSEAQGPGDYTFTVAVSDDATDAVNGALSVSQTISVYVSEVNRSPVIESIVGPPTVNEGTEWQAVIRVSDPDLPANTLSVSLDPAALALGAQLVQRAETNVWDLHWTPSEAQGPGDYTFTVTVSDDATGVVNGALSVSQAVSVRVNEVNQAPVIVSIVGPPTVDEETAWSATVTATDADVPANTLTASLDAAALAQGVTIQPGTVAGTWTLHWTPSEAQGPGDYTFTVTVSDNATDAVNGALSVSQAVSVHVNEVNRPPVLALIGNKTVVEGTRQLELAPIRNKTVAEETPGLLPLSFTATATNQGPGVPPLTFKATAADDDRPNNSLTFSLAAPSVVQPGAIGGVPAGAQIGETTGEFVWNLDESHVGHTYAFDVVVKDGTGTANDSDRETITVTVTGNSQPNNLTFSLEAPLVVPPGAFGGVADGATINSMTGLFEWAPTELQGGNTYAFDVVVTDGAETDRETITVTVNEVNRAPVIVSIIGPPTVDEHTPLTPWQAVVTASDPDVPVNNLTASLDAVALTRGVTIQQGAVAGTWTLNWTPSEADGPDDYTFTVAVSDNAVGAVNGALTASQPVTVHVNEFNQTPVVSIVGAATVNEQTEWQAAVTALDPDVPVNNLTASLDAAAQGLGVTIQSGAAPNTWNLSWTPTELQGPGDYIFTVTVSDNAVGAVNGALTASQPVTVHVNEFNQTPVVSIVGAATVNEQTEWQAAVTALDPDVPVNNLTASLDAAAQGLGVTIQSGAAPNTWNLSWTPTELQGPGDYIFTVTVSDNALGAVNGALTASQPVTVHVNEVNQAPVLALIPDQTMKEQTVLRVPILVTDPDEPANQLKVELAVTPTWATIEAETDPLTPHAWELVLKPDEEQGPDVYALNVRVRDNAVGAVNGELMDSQFVTVRVNEENRAPEVTIVPLQPTAVEGMPWQAVVTASDPDIPANQLNAILDDASIALGAELVRRGTTNVWDLFWTPSAGNGSGGGTSVASFQGLGDLPGSFFESRPSAMSGNGAVVVGQSISANGDDAFRWTPTGGAGSYTLKVLVTDTGTPAHFSEQTVTVTVSGGMENLSSLIGGSFAQVRATSFDGSVLVGKTAEGMAFLWSQLDGFQIIAGEGANFTSANAVSSDGSIDGSIVVGGGYIYPFTSASAFRWTAATDAIRLDNLSGYDNSEAFAVSNDGSVIVGVSYTGPGMPYQGLDDQQAQAVRWVADGLGGFTVEALGDLPGGNVESHAVAVSADGTVIVGVSESALGPEAFRWTATEGMQRLGDGALGGAVAISADGSVIIGGTLGGDIFVWEQNNGVRSLIQVLFELGVPMDGWGILALVGISADGRTIIGEGVNPQGNVEAWRLVLPENAFAPVFDIAPIGNYQVPAGQNISFFISATDGDVSSQLVRYRLIGNVPPGVTFANHGTFSWDPTTDDLGDYAFTIRAYDSGVPSRFTDRQFSITVTL